MKCFKTHWINEPSVLQVPRTNLPAERWIKVMEDLKQRSRKDLYLNTKFVATNELLD